MSFKSCYLKVLLENTSQKYVLYHGTYGTYNKFSFHPTSKNTDFGYYGYGFYFTPNEKTARIYGPNLYKCEVELSNPLIWEGSKEALWEKYGLEENENPEKNKSDSIKLTKSIVNAGYDSVLVKTAGTSNILEVCVFNPEKIKIISKQIVSNYMDFDYE